MNFLPKLSAALFSLGILAPALIQAAIVPITVNQGSPVTASRTKAAVLTSSGGIQTSGPLVSLLSYTVTWTLTNLGNNAYQYDYTVSALNGLNALKNDFFIETDPTVLSSSLTNISILNGITDIYTNGGVTISDATQNGVNGILFHNTALNGSSLLMSKLSFVVNAAPVWGSFRNGSLLDLSSYVQNISFTSDPTTTNYTNWVASVGSLITPEPTILLTLTSSLTAAYFLSRRKAKSKLA